MKVFPAPCRPNAVSHAALAINMFTPKSWQRRRRRGASRGEAHAQLKGCSDNSKAAFLPSLPYWSHKSGGKRLRRWQTNVTHCHLEQRAPSEHPFQERGGGEGAAEFWKQVFLCSPTRRTGVVDLFYLGHFTRSTNSFPDEIQFMRQRGLQRDVMNHCFSSPRARSLPLRDGWAV